MAGKNRDKYSDVDWDEQLMTQAEELAARRKNLMDHALLLEKRYPEPEYREMVALLRNRLAMLEMRVV